MEKVLRSLPKRTGFTATEDYESHFRGSKKLQCSNGHRKFLPLRSAQFMRARPEHQSRSPSKFEGQ